VISIAVGGLHFPECLRWYENRLFFSDMYGDAVLAFDPENGELETVAEVFHPAGIGWLPDGRMLAVASEDKTILEVGNGGNRLYADLGHTSPGFLNDMLVDRTGRIYAGNFGYDLFNDEPCPTQLIVVDTDGKAALQADDVVFPNGIVKRSDGKLVVAESFGKCLTTFSVDDDGSVWRESSISLGELVPDGICIDAEDHVWISSVYTDEVVRGPRRRDGAPSRRAGRVRVHARRRRRPDAVRGHGAGLRARRTARSCRRADRDPAGRGARRGRTGARCLTSATSP